MSKEQIQFLTYTALINSGGGGGGDPSNWSSYPALTSVSMGGNSLNYNSNTSLSPTTLTINSNTTLSSSGLNLLSNTSFSPTMLTVNSNTTLSSSGLNLTSNTSLSPSQLTVNSNTTLSSSGLNLTSNTSLSPSQLTMNNNATLSTSTLNLATPTGHSVILNTTDGLTITRPFNPTTPMLNVVSSFTTSNLEVLRGSLGITSGNVVSLSLDLGGVYLTTIDSNTITAIPLTITSQPITLNMGGLSNQQLLLQNTRDSQSGYLWVDSNGGLNWNNTLIANGTPPH